MTKIGIIGSGNIGGALTRLFKKAGHEVAVSNSRGPATLEALSRETGARAVTVAQAVRDSEVVVVAVPMVCVGDLPKDLLRDAPAGLIVIDTSNYYPQQRDGKIAAVEAGMPESAWVAQQLGRPVVKVFNTIIAAHLESKGSAAATPGRVALAVAGDDPLARATVMRLVEDIGFDAVDAGTIEQSWRQQPGSPGYLQDYDAAGVRRALADATPARAAEWRATPDSPGTFESPA